MTPAAGSGAIPLSSTRGLIGASFDLLSVASEEMRRASFYIGLVVLGAIGPFALATWVVGVKTVHLTVRRAQALADGPIAVEFVVLAIPVLVGIIVAFVESRNMAAAILGARMIRRPLTMERALARSRMVFGRAIAVGFLAGIPLAITQALFQGLLDAVFPVGTEGTILAAIVAAITVGAWFAYVLSGVVLGDVSAPEAVARSFRVYRARKVAAALVALFEATAVLLILFGLSAGLDLALRVFDALGLGADAGPAGLLLVTVGIIVAVFAFGTLILTVSAISIAPQVVMFVGLTHATVGLEHVRPGGDHDPNVDPRARRTPAALPREVPGGTSEPTPSVWSRPPDRPAFRVITRPTAVMIAVSWVTLGLIVAQAATFH